MKITSFQLTIQQSLDEQGYSDNFYISVDDKGLTSICRPYKYIPIEEQLAIEEVITAAIKAYIKFVKQADYANKDLKLEEYAPIVSTEEISSKSTESRQPNGDIFGAPEVPTESAAPQSCALGDGEVSTGVEDAQFEETKTLAQQIEDNVIESLGLK